MTLVLRPAVKTEQQLKALAASGASGFARRAQAELRARRIAELQSAVKPS